MVGLIDSVGSGLYLTGSAAFLTQTAGLSAPEVGIGLSANGLVGLAMTVPVGRLADRLGPHRTLVALQLWQAVGFLGLALVRDFPEFLAASVFLGLADKTAPPVSQALISIAVGGTSKVRALAMWRTLRNVGYGLGALVTTAVLMAPSALGYRGLVLGDAVSFAVAAAALRGISLARPADAAAEEPEPVPDAAPTEAGPASVGALRDWPYLILAGLNAVLLLYLAVLTTGLPLWVIGHTRAPRAVIGLAMVVNTVGASLFQVRSARGCDRPPVAARRIAWSGCLLAVSTGALALSGQLPGPLAGAVIVLAAVLLTGGELGQSGGGWGLALALAPDTRRTEYLATFSLGLSAQAVVGPALLTVAVIDNSTPGWLALGLCFAVAGLTVPAVTRWALRRRSAGTAQLTASERRR